jgi:hypothetical protein
LNIVALFLQIDKWVSEVDFDGLFNAAVGVESAVIQDEEVVSEEDLDEDEGDDEDSLPSTPASAAASSVKAAKAKYQELLAKARKYPGGGEAP